LYAAAGAAHNARASSASRVARSGMARRYRLPA
jgi:hypothetical protein